MYKYKNKHRGKNRVAEIKKNDILDRILYDIIIMIAVDYERASKMIKFVSLLYSPVL